MRAGQRGAVLITGIVLLVVIALMVATLGFLYVSNLRSSSLHSSSEQAYFAAFSGLERATRVLNSPTISGAVAPDVNRVPCTSLTGDASVTAVTLVANKGQFTVTGGAAVYPATPVTLNGALSNVATVIPVTTLAALGGYSASGRIMIDRELIDYSGTSNVGAVCGTAPCFVGARRGTAGTGAVLHATGTRVGQFQCNIQSRGGVPDLASPRAARILSQGTQLNEVWAVGRDAGTTATSPWIVRFQQTGPWSTINNSSINITANLNSLSMISYADGFAVGDSAGAGTPYIVRWDGSAWSLVNTGLGIARDLNGVYCVSANDCWMVGDGGAGAARQWFVRWDGTTWSSILVGVNRNLDMMSVYCVSSPECYAVGTSRNDADDQPVTFRLIAGTWTKDTNNLGTGNQDLFSIHCSGMNDCWAVGQDNNAQPLTVRWNGAWAVINNGIAVRQNLNSVYCISTNDCWAVGNSGTLAEGARPFIARWDGAWSVFPHGLIFNVNLQSVWCSDTNNCWAVGAATGGTPLVLKWDGVNWRQVSTTGLANERLRGIQSIAAASRPFAARQEVYP